MWSDGTTRILLDVRRNAQTISRTAVARYAETSHFYASGDVPDHLFRESAHTIRVFVDVTCSAVLGEQSDVPGALSDVLDRGAERAAEGLPVREYIRCWQVAMAVLDERVRERMPAGDEDTAPLLIALRTVYDEILRNATESYTLHATALAAADSDRDSATLDALFAGTHSPGDAAGAPERPIVVLAHVPRSTAEDNAPDESARALAARRKARRIRGRIERVVTGLWLLDVRENAVRMISAPERTDWTALADDLSGAADAAVTLSVVTAESAADLPRAAGVASDVLRTALRIGTGGRAVTLEDVALPLHLTHHSPGLATLLERCAPIIERPELAETCRAYLRSAMDRRATADLLGVHPNTVDNRLTKVRTLTGLDVHRAEDLITVAIAVDPALGWCDPEPPASA